MKELRIFNPTGLTVSATVINTTTGTTTSVALTETLSGYYVADFPTIAAGTYDVRFSDGTNNIGVTTLVWNGTTATTIQTTEIENYISALGLTVNISSPISTSGTITIVAGDDYNSADGRAITISFTGVPDLTGGNVELNTYRITDRYLAFSVTGIVTNPSNNPTIAFNLAKTTTSILNVGDPGYEYAVVAILANGDKITLQTGDLVVTE
jgi:hypothetical protein